MSLEALVNGQAVEVGSDSASAVLDPTVSDNAVAFAITPSASLAGADVQALDLRVHVHGRTSTPAISVCPASRTRMSRRSRRA